MPFYALLYHIGVRKGMEGHWEGIGHKLEESRPSTSCLDDSRLSSLSLKTSICYKISGAFSKSTSAPDQLVESIGSLIPWVASAKRSRRHHVRGIESEQTLQ